MERGATDGRDGARIAFLILRAGEGVKAVRRGAHVGGRQALQTIHSAFSRTRYPSHSPVRPRRAAAPRFVHSVVIVECTNLGLTQNGQRSGEREGYRVGKHVLSR
jgi:hypothetical protein